MRKLILVLIATAHLFGCTDHQAAAPGGQQSETAVQPKAREFNVNDKSISTNENVPVGMIKVERESPDSLWSKAESVSVNKMTKSPYSSLGKIRKIKGQIYKLEELPPTEGQQGSWAEILLLADNPNSPAGVTTVSFIYNGDISEINANQVVSCAGYFVGTYESQNMVGGTVEGLVLVGNKLVRL